MSDDLLYAASDGIARVTFNRPEKRNAMNPRLHDEMTAALEALRYDNEARVLVITGAGNAFCAGMDLKEVFHALKDQPARDELINLLSRQNELRRLLSRRQTAAQPAG